jgi:hypothetical protein
MRRQILHPLLAFPLLLTSVLPYALAQTQEEQTANDSLTAEKIIVARGPYTLHEEFARCWGEGQTLPERAQRRPVSPAPPQIRYPSRRGYGMGRQRGNGRHVLIGALIGFGIGAALGAKGNRDPHTRVISPVLFGSVGALIGAAVGASHP